MRTLGHITWMALALGTLAVCGCAPGGTQVGDEGLLRRYEGQEPPVTILVNEFFGPQARQLGEGLRNELSTKGYPDVFVVADDDEAYVCNGLYDDLEDAKLKRDRLAIKTRIVDPTGRPAFPWAEPSPLPETAPASRYDLAQAKGDYTVQVATFDLYGRKRAANAYADKLRRQGKPAYVYHGPTMSHVTLGAFNRSIFDDWTRINNMYNPARIVSPEVLRILKDYPYQNWNGQVITADEAAKMKVRRKTTVFDPRTRQTSQELVTDYGELFKCKVVAVPREVRRPGRPAPPAQPGTGEMPPTPPPGPSGPELSPGR